MSVAPTKPRKANPTKEIVVRTITAEDIPQIEELFGTNGACGGCWCMIWRVPSTGAYWKAHKGEMNRRAFQSLVRAGAAKGCLAFDGKIPIGWCSFGPREDFAYLARSRSIPHAIEPDTWAITCFFVAPTHRSRGISELLIECACEGAQNAGAKLIEAYPTLPRKEPAPPAFVHTGLPSPFHRQGFSKSANAGARVVMCKRL